MVLSMTRSEQGLLPGSRPDSDAVLQESEAYRAQLAAIVDSSDDGIISKTLDGTITSWNRSAERLFGWSATEAIGQHITLIIPTDRLSEETDVIARIRRGERVDHFAHLARRHRPAPPDPRRLDLWPRGAPRCGSAPATSGPRLGAPSDAAHSRLVRVHNGVPPGAGRRRLMAARPDLGARSAAAPPGPMNPRCRADGAWRSSDSSANHTQCH